MGASITAVQARCPLCGSLVLSVGRSGRVVTDVVHPIRLGRVLGRGYTVCDECGVLADLPARLTLN
jgi:hypothetical protein